MAKVLELQLQPQSFQWILRTDFLQDRLVWSPCSPRNSQESSPTPQFKCINSSAISLLYGPSLTSIHDYFPILSQRTPKWPVCKGQDLIKVEIPTGCFIKDICKGNTFFFKLLMCGEEPLPCWVIRLQQFPHNCFCTISANVSTVKRTVSLC